VDQFSVGRWSYAAGPVRAPCFLPTASAPRCGRRGSRPDGSAISRPSSQPLRAHLLPGPSAARVIRPARSGTDWSARAIRPGRCRRRSCWHSAQFHRAQLHWAQLHWAQLHWAQSPSGSPPLSRGLRAPAFWPVSRRPRGRRNCSAPIQGKPGRLPSGPSGPFLSHRLTELPGSQCSAPRSPCSGLRVTVLRSPGHRALLSGSPCSALRITVLGSPGHRAHLLGAPTAGPGSTHRPGPVNFRPTRLVATE
jgi:hypothetical protein